MTFVELYMKVAQMVSKCLASGIWVSLSANEHNGITVSLSDEDDHFTFFHFYAHAPHDWVGEVERLNKFIKDIV